MGKMSFAICDSNEVYAKKLYEYFFVNESDSYEMMLFTSRQELSEYLERRRLEVLLISDDLIGPEEKIENVDHLMILKTDDYGGSKNYSSIYKYKAGDILLKEVMYYCAQNGESHVKRQGSRTLKIIGVYSPIKRCFQTTFSITLGQILAQRGKAIYLNFENYAGFDMLQKWTSSQDISDLMYFLGCGSENFSYRLQSMINQIGELHFISPSHSYITRMNIKKEDWICLLDSFEKYTDYEYLILDLSENIIGLFDILRACSFVYTIVADDHVSKAKLLQYKTLLQKNDFEDVFDKTKLINVPMFKEIPLEYEMLPFSELAKYTRKMLKEDKLI